MIDYTSPPVAYLVRIPQADQDSLLHDAAIERAEDAARFIGFERIGRIISSPAAAAVETAEIIFSVCCSTAERAAAPEVDERLEETIGAYLRDREAGAPSVLVCDLAVLRAGLAMAGVVVEPGDELVAPGGIVSIHRDPAGKPELLAIARHMIMNFKFADVVEMIAGSPQHAKPARAGDPAGEGTQA